MGSAGCWKAGGMGGLAGVDWSGVKVLAEGDPLAGHWPDLAALIRSIEGGALKGAARKAEREKPADNGGEHGR